MPRAKAAPVGPALGSLIRQPYPPKVEGKEARAAALDLINSGEVKGCKLCRELAAYRTQTVFGVGNVTPRVVMFGEAPGADEDKQGEPFVGRAGQLLNKIIEACTWKREEVYILNTLEMPPAGQPPARAARARQLPPVLGAATGNPPAGVHRLPRHARGPVAAGNGRNHRPAAEQILHLPRQQGHRHVSSVLPATLPRRQEAGLGRHADAA